MLRLSSIGGRAAMRAGAAVRLQQGKCVSLVQSSVQPQTDKASIEAGNTAVAPWGAMSRWTRQLYRRLARFHHSCDP